VITTSPLAIRAVRAAVAADFAVGEVLGAAVTTPASVSRGSSGVSITSFENTIAKGEEDSLTVHSVVSGDACALSVRLPSGNDSRSKGLGAATANQSGNVTWQWAIGSSTKAGTATASITCKAGSIARTFTIT
jgi:hypothetical protein